MREAEDDVVAQFSDSEDDNFDVRIEQPTDNSDHAPGDMRGIADPLVMNGWRRVDFVFPNACSCCGLH